MKSNCRHCGKQHGRVSGDVSICYDCARKVATEKMHLRLKQVKGLNRRDMAAVERDTQYHSMHPDGAMMSATTEAAISSRVFAIAEKLRIARGGNENRAGWAISAPVEVLEPSGTHRINGRVVKHGLLF